MNNILVIDNYDSFTYNLVQYVINATGHKPTVIRNDKISLNDIEAFNKILISPGPGIPKNAGRILDIIKQYGPSKSILGVCLGMQAIAEVYGSQLYNLSTVYHGVASLVDTTKNSALFEGIPSQIKVGRYHSWAVKPETISSELDITATTKDGCIMAIKHTKYDVQGLQFHPESVLTEHGQIMINNWVNS